MDYIDCATIQSFLKNLEVPPLTEDEENKLTQDEVAERETLGANIQQLQNIGLQIDHCVMVSSGTEYIVRRPFEKLP